MSAEELIETITDTGREPERYSGRGMYGRECVAVSLDQDDNGHDLPDEGCRTDSLGLGKIIYWPWAKPTEHL
jgi:hypothetical protein